MHILFCDNALDTRSVDPDFEDEYIAAQQNGCTTHLFSFERLTKDLDPAGALRKIKRKEAEQILLYRGWMLKPDQYQALYEALLGKNYRLINSPEAYRTCHYLPDSYNFIQEHTPATIWLTLENGMVDYEQIFEAITVFGNAPLMIKDFVKSQKHYWDTACYIPAAADRDRVKAVIGRFVELQGTDLNEGLVIREFVRLQDLTVHSKSGMPLKQEYRMFFLNGQSLGCYAYWEEGTYAAAAYPPPGLFETVSGKIPSAFFSMDIAQTTDGDWIIVELGDGQVAGLPDQTDRYAFYSLVQRYGG